MSNRYSKVIGKAHKTVSSAKKNLDSYQSNLRKLERITDHDDYGKVAEFYKRMEREMLEALRELRSDTIQLGKHLNDLKIEHKNYIGKGGKEIVN